MLGRIASAAAGPGDAVVEIGSGRGALTRHLLERASRLVAVEIDPALAAELPQRCGRPAHLQVVCADILDIDLLSLAAEWELSKAVIAGNLPYYITSPILRSVLAAGAAFRRATLLMQEEVADRAVAGPGTRAYGYLSCLCRLASEPRKLFSVPPGAFHPPPKVRSAVVEFRLRREAPPPGLLDFLGACFRAPRKTLRNNLAGRFPPASVAGDPLAGQRAQQVDLENLMAMWRRLGPAAGSSRLA